MYTNLVRVALLAQRLPSFWGDHMARNHAYVWCPTFEPLSKVEAPHLVNLDSERHKVSPSFIEGRILKHISPSSNIFRAYPSADRLQGSELVETLNSYLEARGKFLTYVKRFREVGAFVDDIFERYESIEVSIKESKKGQRMTLPRPRRTPTFLQSLRNACDRETKIAREVQELLLKYDTILQKAIEARKETDPKLLNDFLAWICSLDTEWISWDLPIGDELAVAIPLDFHPSRLPLTMLAEDILAREQLRYPPLFLSYRDPARLMKPYRALDGHPIMIRVPTLLSETEPEAEIRKVKAITRDSTGPLVRRLKGLFGRRETSPRIVRAALVAIIKAYLKYNPMSVDHLRILDLGCGLGDLSRAMYKMLLRDFDESRDLYIETLINDIQDEPGSLLRLLARQEEYRRHMECKINQGDMGELVARLSERRERFDILFANRVFDMYGNYMIQGFSRKPLEEDSSLSGRYDEMSPKTYAGAPSVLAFTRTGMHQELWRAFRYRLGRGEFDVSQDPSIRYLPSVEMNVLRNAFGKKPEEWNKTLSMLVDLAEVSVITVFPGTLKTLFPIPHFERLGVHTIERIDEASQWYTLICLTRDIELKGRVQQAVDSSFAAEA